MPVPTFVDLQKFIVNKKFIMKEVTVLKQGIVFTHYIFTSFLVSWKFLTRSERSCVSWLSAYHHAMGGRDGPTTRRNAWSWRLHLKMMYAIVYIKERETNVTVELVSGARTHVHRDLGCNLQRHGIFNLDVANTMRCGQHVKNCALQNVLKIYNWWWLAKEFFK